MTILKYRTNQALIGTGFNQPSGQTLTLSGNTFIDNYGTFKYCTDQSSIYVARSIVDAEFVTGATSHIINIGSIGQVIYRSSSGITGATGFLFDSATSGVTAPNICISQTPPNDTCLDFILSWDDTSKQIHKIPYASTAGLSTACNGLSSSGGVVCLGGSLCVNTIISGGSSSFCINNENNNIVIDNRSNGGVYMKSQSGLCPYYNTFTDAVGFVIDYGAGFKIYDNRTGVNQKGIEYNDNYSSFYSPRSLVDKSYVDAVASGLQPHPAVDVATTTNIELTGLTGTTIIDGIVVNEGYRVLVKDQDPFAEKNGIYVLTGTTLVRADDFNESSESVHGAYTFVLSGNTHANQSWVLSTPNPIIIDVTPLHFTLFNQVTNLVAGTGITIGVCYGEHTISVDGQSLAGNSISWTGDTFNVDVNSGTLSTALNNKLNISTFGGYTGTTRNELDLTITGGTNGLTKSGRQIKLGGDLLSGTTISGAHDLNFNVNNLNLSGNTNLNLTFSAGTITNTSNYGGLRYESDYSTYYDARSLVDVAYVTGYTKCMSNIVDVCNVSGTYSATTDNYFIGADSGSIIFLPNTPKCGQIISIADCSGNALANNISVCSDTCSILNAQEATINTDYGSMTFIFNTVFWSAVAFTN